MSRRTGRDTDPPLDDPAAAEGERRRAQREMAREVAAEDPDLEPRDVRTRIDTRRGTQDARLTEGARERLTRRDFATEAAEDLSAFDELHPDDDLLFTDGEVMLRDSIIEQEEAFHEQQAREELAAEAADDLEYFDTLDPAEHTQIDDGQVTLRDSVISQEEAFREQLAREELAANVGSELEFTSVDPFDDIRQTDDGFEIRDRVLEREQAAAEEQAWQEAADEIDEQIPFFDVGTDEITEIDDGIGLDPSLDDELEQAEREWAAGELDSEYIFTSVQPDDVRRTDDGWDLTMSARSRHDSRMYEMMTPVWEERAAFEIGREIGLDVDPSDIRLRSDGAELTSDFQIDHADELGITGDIESSLAADGFDVEVGSGDLEAVSAGEIGLAEDFQAEIAADQIGQDLGVDVGADQLTETADGFTVRPGARDVVFDTEIETDTTRDFSSTFEQVPRRQTTRTPESTFGRDVSITVPDRVTSDQVPTGPEFTRAQPGTGDVTVSHELAADQIGANIGAELDGRDIVQTADGFQLGRHAERELQADRLTDEFGRTVEPSDLARDREGFDLTTSAERELMTDQFAGDLGIDADQVVGVTETPDGFTPELTLGAQAELIAQEDDEIEEEDLEFDPETGEWFTLEEEGRDATTTATMVEMLTRGAQFASPYITAEEGFEEDVSLAFEQEVQQPLIEFDRTGLATDSVIGPLRDTFLDREQTEVEPGPGAAFSAQRLEDREDEPASPELVSMLPDPTDELSIGPGPREGMEDVEPSDYRPPDTPDRPDVSVGPSEPVESLEESPSDLQVLETITGFADAESEPTVTPGPRDVSTGFEDIDHTPTETREGPGIAVGPGESTPSDADDTPELGSLALSAIGPVAVAGQRGVDFLTDDRPDETTRSDRLQPAADDPRLSREIERTVPDTDRPARPEVGPSAVDEELQPLDDVFDRTGEAPFSDQQFDPSGVAPMDPAIIGLEAISESERLEDAREWLTGTAEDILTAEIDPERSDVQVQDMLGVGAVGAVRRGAVGVGARFGDDAVRVGDDVITGGRRVTDTIGGRVDPEDIAVGIGAGLGALGASQVQHEFQPEEERRTIDDPELPVQDQTAFQDPDLPIPEDAVGIGAPDVVVPEGEVGFEAPDVAIPEGEVGFEAPDVEIPEGADMVDPGVIQFSPIMQQTGLQEEIDRVEREEGVVLTREEIMDPEIIQQEERAELARQAQEQTLFEQEREFGPIDETIAITERAEPSAFELEEVGEQPWETPGTRAREWEEMTPWERQTLLGQIDGSSLQEEAVQPQVVRDRQLFDRTVEDTSLFEEAAESTMAFEQQQMFESIADQGFMEPGGVFAPPQPLGLGIEETPLERERVAEREAVDERAMEDEMAVEQLGFGQPQMFDQQLGQMTPQMTEQMQEFGRVDMFSPNLMETPAAIEDPTQMGYPLEYGYGQARSPRIRPPFALPPLPFFGSETEYGDEELAFDAQQFENPFATAADVMGTGFGEPGGDIFGGEMADAFGEPGEGVLGGPMEEPFGGIFGSPGPEENDEGPFGGLPF